LTGYQNFLNVTASPSCTTRGVSAPNLRESIKGSINISPHSSFGSHAVFTLGGVGVGTVSNCVFTFTDATGSTQTITAAMNLVRGPITVSPSAFGIICFAGANA
jgi:hypothetical protein